MGRSKVEWGRLNLTGPTALPSRHWLADDTRVGTESAYLSRSPNFACAFATFGIGFTWIRVKPG
jgi:hypothetical protein